MRFASFARVGPRRYVHIAVVGQPPDARGHVADARVLGHDEQVAAKRDVAAARDRMAVHFRDRGLAAFPERHEVFGVALHEGVVVHRVRPTRLIHSTPQSRFHPSTTRRNAMKRITLVRSALATGALFALAGCSHMHMHDEGSAGGSMAMTQTYVATLTAGEEVPPAAESQGRGTAEVTIDLKTYDVTYKVSWSGLTGPATMGHIHGPAEPGKNAGVVVPFANVAGASSAEGKGKLDATKYGDLAAGFYYVNIHTAKYPGGEIRGQLKRK